jgi:uncharacterized protein DUF4395
MASVLGFPRTVNDKAARTVATGVVALTVVTAATGWYWLTIPLAYGFIAPRLGAPKIVPGPPKRFAQGIGVAFSTTALVLGLVLGLGTAATAVLLALAVAASLEAFAGLCLGCEIFRLGMRFGVVPETVCAECADIWARPRPSSA